MNNAEREKLLKESKDWAKTAKPLAPEDARRLQEKWRVDGLSMTPDMVRESN